MEKILMLLFYSVVNSSVSENKTYNVQEAWEMFEAWRLSREGRVGLQWHSAVCPNF